MSRTNKIVNLIGVPLPLIALVVAVALLWDRAVGPLELGLMVFFYVVTALGVTVGYHRMFTHRAFESSRAFRAVIGVFGSMAVEGSVITWVADHRKHHAFTDQEGDPHSPHLLGPGLRRRRQGAVACACRLVVRDGRDGRARALRSRPGQGPGRARDRQAVLGLGRARVLIPFVLGWIVGGGSAPRLTALLWGGFVRVFLLHHVTWSINSVCHFVGRKRFDVDDESRNVFWLAPLSMGEAWHHNHHAFPTSAFHGLSPIERLPTRRAVDPELEKLGVIWNVVRSARSARRAKAARRSLTRRRRHVGRRLR